MFVFQSSSTALICWKLCVLQFLFVKPSLSAYTAYSERRENAIYTDRWVKPIALFSVTIAMWALLSTYLALEPVSASFRKLHVPAKFVVIKCAIFLTVAQELCFHILVASGRVKSPYCWWAGPSERCLDIMGFSTPSARRGVRTIATLVVIEMFCLQFLLLRYYSFADEILGDIVHVSEKKISITHFFLEPSWSIEPWIMSLKMKKSMQQNAEEERNLNRDGGEKEQQEEEQEQEQEEREDVERRGGGSGGGEEQHAHEGDVEDTEVKKFSPNASDGDV